MAGVSLILTRDWVQPFPELATGAVQADLGRRFRYAEFSSDGFMGEVVHIAQYHNGPKPRREFGQCRLHPIPYRTAVGLLGGIYSSRQVNDVFVVLEHIVTMPSPLAERRGGAVGGYAVKPRRKLGLAPKPLEPAERPQIGILDNIAGVVLITGKAIGQIVSVHVRHPYQLFEGRVITLTGLHDQVLKPST